METGGEIELKTSGEIGTGEDTGDGFFWGLTFSGKVAVTPSYPHQATWLLGVWYSPGTPTPRWVIGVELDTKNQVYQKYVVDWLRSKGISHNVILKVVIDQIVKADLNGDKRDEVFIAFRTSDVGHPDYGIGSSIQERPSKHTFSYLIMRYLPAGSNAVKTVVMNNTPG